MSSEGTDQSEQQIFIDPVTEMKISYTLAWKAMGGSLWHHS